MALHEAELAWSPAAVQLCGKATDGTGAAPCPGAHHTLLLFCCAKAARGQTPEAIAVLV